MTKERYRYKRSKTPVKCRPGKIVDGVVVSYQVATGGDFRKGYITFTREEFEELFEKY